MEVKKLNKTRYFIVIISFIAIFSTILLRLIQFGTIIPASETVMMQPAGMHRPLITDRNGRILAMDIKAYSLYAEPRRITHVDEVAEQIHRIMPELSLKTLHEKLSGKRGFVWLARQLPPSLKSKLMSEGIPGIGFRTELQRVYPAGRATSHIVGLTNIDNKGVAGLEKWIDGQGIDDIRNAGFSSPENFTPVTTSVDLRIQHALHDELTKAMLKYEAAGAGSVILNIKTGEIMGLVSLPDFDPNVPDEVHLTDRLNRITASSSEMGSIIKTFTTAMVVELANADLTTIYDATNPLKVGNQLVRDYFGKKRPLTLEEVFLYSSNIGSAQEALSVGAHAHRDFLKKAGLLDQINLEIPETSKPMEPVNWSDATSITASYGHGFATTPLQTAAGIGGILNQGILVQPTLLKREATLQSMPARRLVGEHASGIVRHLYRLSALKGSARRANVHGLSVGGKTGTAEKVIDGRYAKNRNYNVFAAALPMHDPSHVILTVIDDPKPKSATRGLTAGRTAVPVTAEIIKRTFDFLDISPL